MFTRRTNLYGNTRRMINVIFGLEKGLGCLFQDGGREKEREREGEEEGAKLQRAISRPELSRAMW